LARPIADGTRGRSQMVGVMMTVHAVDHLDAHAKEACGFPAIDASPHQPSRRRMTQGVWRDFT